MNRMNPQRGVGMIEVLVALLLLAIGVLGFTALQLHAVDATAEGLNRVQGMNLARDLAERIRANRTGLSAYIDNTNTATAITAKTCTGDTTCTSTEMAAYDVKQVKEKALTFNATIAMPKCQGVSNGRNCIYVAWDRTTPDNGTAITNCTNAGNYQSESRCIVMEAY